LKTDSESLNSDAVKNMQTLYIIEKKRYKATQLWLYNIIVLQRINKKPPESTVMTQTLKR